jgi:hypothetical protein
VPNSIVVPTATRTTVGGGLLLLRKVINLEGEDTPTEPWRHAQLIIVHVVVPWPIPFWLMIWKEKARPWLATTGTTREFQARTTTHIDTHPIYLIEERERTALFYILIV